MKNKVYKDSLYVDVYETNVYIGMCKNSKDLEEWYYSLTKTKKENNNFFPASAISFYDSSGEHWVMFIKKYFDLNTCAHECFHLTHNFMYDINHEFHIEEHEPHSWLNGFLVDKIYKIGKKLCKKIK